MGVINVTPDSFYDGGRFFESSRAIERGLELASQGADILDIGGESTRPGAAAVSIDTELERVIPVIEVLARQLNALISIDTAKAEVAGQALAAGADIINDISGLRFDPKLAKLAAELSTPLILGHIQGRPENMQHNPRYGSLMDEICNDLSYSINLALAAGVNRRQLVIDPGIGFGKTVQHNLLILKNLSDLRVLELPIMVGPSRKSFIGKILGLDPEERREGTLAAAALAIMNGAQLIRTHDVEPLRRVAAILDAAKAA
jgi:dihydropteroate synthase